MIDEVEFTLDRDCVNICRPLNSYINRVYEVITEEGESVECQVYLVPDSRRDMLTEEPWDSQWFAEHKLAKYLKGV